jgi:hypothetical protein
VYRDYRLDAWRNKTTTREPGIEIFILCIIRVLVSSVAEPHHFYAAPAPGKNFDAAPAPAAPAPAPTLFYSKAKILKRTKI